MSYHYFKKVSIMSDEKELQSRIEELEKELEYYMDELEYYRTELEDAYKQLDEYENLNKHYTEILDTLACIAVGYVDNCDYDDIYEFVRNGDNKSNEELLILGYSEYSNTIGQTGSDICSINLRIVYQ